MRIDIYAHLMTQKTVDAFNKRVGNLEIMGMRPDLNPGGRLNIDDFSVEKRIEIMNKYPGLVQVLIPTGQPLEWYASPDDAAYIAKLYNDELAEVVHKYPDKFVAAVACMPMNNLDAALKEIDRAINELGFKGIFVQTPVNGRPIDLPEFMPIYERMLDYDLPIWIHPMRHFSFADYTNEDASKYGLFHAFGWPFETTIALGRLVCSGILAKHPNLKFITHHAGAMIPFFAGRISQLNCSFGEGRVSEEELTKQFRMFYNDTALNGNARGVVCAHDFFGTEHMLFGTDMPYGRALGEQFLSSTIDAIDGMNIPDADKKKIYEENARALLRLDI